ncbi:hypothetical protein RT21_19545 [Pseudomonas sp. 10B238]|nr:hypothetical protein RT21_19545 [Pseudomonas sp. 10B238]
MHPHKHPTFRRGFNIDKIQMQRLTLPQSTIVQKQGYSLAFIIEFKVIRSITSRIRANKSVINQIIKPILRKTLDKIYTVLFWLGRLDLSNTLRLLSGHRVIRKMIQKNPCLLMVISAPTHPLLN